MIIIILSKNYALKLKVISKFRVPLVYVLVLGRGGFPPVPFVSPFPPQSLPRPQLEWGGETGE